MLRTKISILSMAALVLGVGAGVSQAQTPVADTFQVNYFAGANGARPDQTVRITNPGTAVTGTVTADVCANIYVFRKDQQLAECCSCLITPNGLRTLSVDFDLANNPLTAGAIGEGVIKIVSSSPSSGGGTCPLRPDATGLGGTKAGTTYVASPALRAWAVHNQDVSGSPALAASFSSRAAFNAATTGNTIVTFNGIAPPGGFSAIGINGSTTLSGVTFTSSGGNLLIVVDQGFNPAVYTTGSASAGGVLSSQNGNSTPAILTITLPTPVTAVGFDTNTAGTTPGATVTVTLSDGEVFSYTTTGSTGRFFGFTTGVGITSLTLTKPSGGTSDILNIDDFTFGQAVGPINQVTETHFLDATLSAAELSELQSNCGFIIDQGSTHGICKCGRGD